jgi:hypothetical protein
MISAIKLFVAEYRLYFYLAAAVALFAAGWQVRAWKDHSGELSAAQEALSAQLQAEQTQHTKDSTQAAYDTKIARETAQALEDARGSLEEAQKMIAEAQQGKKLTRTVVIHDENGNNTCPGFSADFVSKHNDLAGSSSSASSAF